MRNIKEYKAPTAQITEFECADDIMTASLQLKKRPASATVDYVYAGSKGWQNGFRQDN